MKLNQCRTKELVIVGELIIDNDSSNIGNTKENSRRKEFEIQENLKAFSEKLKCRNDVSSIPLFF